VSTARRGRSRFSRAPSWLLACGGVLVVAAGCSRESAARNERGENVATELPVEPGVITPQGGLCFPACTGSTTCCNGACAALATDVNNCGACGNVCATGSSCCGGTCIDPTSDTSNCGSCGHACAAGATCDGSMCCPAGQANCGGTCVDVTSNVSHCGACGKTCAAGQVCTLGSCGSATSGDAGAGDAAADGGADSGAYASPICATDVCDPACHELDRLDAGLSADTSTETSVATIVTDYQGTSNGFGGAPAGFHAKEVNFSGCLTGGAADYSQCNTDYHCDPGSGQCVRSQPKWSYPTSVCAGIDLTISGTCTDASGNDVTPLCNRGNTAVNHLTYPKVNYYLVNGNHFVFSCPTYATSGSWTLTKDIPPGECIDMPTPPGVSGNTIMYINSDHAIPECGAFQGPTTGPGCYDNWADAKTGGSCVGQTSTGSTTVPAYAPTTLTIAPTTATCPPQEIPQWTVLTYDLKIPKDTSGSGSVLIEARAAGAGADAGAWITVANTAAPTNDPAFCGYTATAGGCPKDLFKVLGGLPYARYPSLGLRMTLTPSPDKLTMPTVVGWQLAYSCIANQ
jgi:hypothetical protein